MFVLVLYYEVTRMRRKLIGMISAFLVYMLCAMPACAEEQELRYTEENSRYVFQEGGLEVYEAYDSTPETELETAELFDETGEVAYPQKELFLAASGQSLEEYIYQAILNKETFIDLYGAGYRVVWGTSDEIFAPYYAVINSHPDLFFAELTNARGTGGYVSRYEMSYDDSYDMGAFTQAAEAALSVIQPGMTDMEKAMVLHDYLAYNCEYDYARYLAGQLSSHPDAYNAYGVLVDKQAVCNGYALAYKYLMEKAGITTYMVSSSGIHHAWNMIILDGEYYMIDVTWDDPVWDKPGKVNHNYMFNSEAVFDHLCSDGSKDWKITNGASTLSISATDTRFDNAYWRAVNNQLVWEDGYFYYTVYQNNKVAIVKNPANTTTDTHTTVYGDIDRWTVLNSSAYYPGLSCAYMTRVGNQLVFNAPTAIYSINFDGTNLKEIYRPDTSTGYIYAFSTDGKQLNYVLSANANISGQPQIQSVAFPELSGCSHTIVIDEGIEATCTADGLTEGQHCADCNEILVEQDIIPAKGHTPVVDERTYDCETDGKSEGLHCGICHEILVEQIDVKAPGHVPVQDNVVPATKETNGLTEGSHCASCGKIFEQQKVILSENNKQKLAEELWLQGINISVFEDGKIGLNYEVEFPNEFDKMDLYVLIKTPNEQSRYNVDKGKDVESEKFVCRFSGVVTAKQMTEKIEIIVCDAQGNRYLDRQYAVADYAYLILNDTTGEYDAAKPLVRALLNYGAHAQMYFDYKLDDLANSKIQDTEASGLDKVEFPVYTFPKSDKLTGIEYRGTSLLLDSTVTIRHYFKISGDAEKYKFNNGKDKLEYDASGYYYVDVEGITPQKFDAVNYLVISDGENSSTLGYSVSNYIGTAREQYSDESLTELMTAMYVFGREVKNYTAK